MSVGYPDYARLSQQGGFELYSAFEISPPYFTYLIEGYVGEWPYINMFTNIGVSSDVMDITLAYFTDSTFTHVVGQRSAIRIGGSAAWTQYANMTPWLGMYYTTISGLAIPVTQWSVYGTTGPADQVQLADNSGAIFQFNSTVPASSTGTIAENGIQPGNGILSWDTSATAWEIDVNALQYSTNTYIRMLTLKSATAAAQGTVFLPMLDTPYQMLLKNNDAAARSFNISWMVSR